MERHHLPSRRGGGDDRQGGAGRRAVVYLLCCIGALCFWSIDAGWKHFQKSYYPRVEAIERAFRDGSALVPLQITSSWPKRSIIGNVSSIVKCLAAANVFLPHAAVAVLCLWLAMRG